MPAGVALEQGEGGERRQLDALAEDERRLHARVGEEQGAIVEKLRRALGHERSLAEFPAECGGGGAPGGLICPALRYRSFAGSRCTRA